jgi:Na+/melibiose symporter-like transporter
VRLAGIKNSQPRLKPQKLNEERTNMSRKHKKADNLTAVITGWHQGAFFVYYSVRIMRDDTQVSWVVVLDVPGLLIAKIVAKAMLRQVRQRQKKCEKFNKRIILI